MRTNFLLIPKAFDADADFAICSLCLQVPFTICTKSQSEMFAVFNKIDPGIREKTHLVFEHSY